MTESVAPKPQMFTVEGAIQALKIANGKVNLIEDIQKGAFFTGVAAGLSGQAGMLANSASLAMYDGEDVEHVALLINGQLAVGTFEYLDDIHVDDEVKLVVTQLEDGPLFVHAILRLKDQLLWTPYSIVHTRLGWIFHAIKLCGGLLIAGWIGLAIMIGMQGSSIMTIGTADQLTIFLGGLFMMSFVGYMSTRSVMELGEKAENIFQALGVANFKRFKIKPYSLMMDYSPATLSAGPSNRSRKGYVFKFDQALAAHEKKFRLL
jgi:hypothetical protein